VVGIALAQQTGEQRKQQVNDEARLRAEVVKVRVEIELLQLEHEVELGHVKSAMAELKNLEGFGEGALPILRADFETKVQQNNRARFSLEFIEDEMKSSREEARRYVDRKKKDFARQAEKLAGKRFDLEDLEKQYHDAK